MDEYLADPANIAAKAKAEKADPRLTRALRRQRQEPVPAPHGTAANEHKAK